MPGLFQFIGFLIFGSNAAFAFVFILAGEGNLLHVILAPVLGVWAIRCFAAYRRAWKRAHQWVGPENMRSEYARRLTWSQPGFRFHHHLLWYYLRR